MKFTMKELVIKKFTTFILCILFSFSALSNEQEYNFEYNLDEDLPKECNDLNDPFEPVNKKIFYFNSFLDYIILKPIAKAYGKVFSDYSKAKVGDFLSNVYEPVTTINYALQGNLDNSLLSFWKFVINSTLGVAGTYDLASQIGINHKHQSFGATLAHYGVEPGPYVVLPFLGGTNMRDMFDVIILDSTLNPVKFYAPSEAKNVHVGVSLVHYRNEIMPFTDYIAQSPDPYAAMRSAIHQRRESIVHYPKGYRCGVRPKKSK